MSEDVRVGNSVFEVEFLGTRGSIPTPGSETMRYGGNTSCVAVYANNSVFICDGGTGLRQLGRSLMEKLHDQLCVHMFFSHSHWDHIQGFPFFEPVYSEASVVFVYGKEHGDNDSYKLVTGQMHSDYFPVEFSELKADIRPAYLQAGGKDIEGVRISWFQQWHPGGSLAYRFEYKGKSVVYATDNELDLTIKNKSEVDKDPSVQRRVNTEYIEFISGADLLIGDGQYLDEEYCDKVGWGHSRATTLTDAAIEAGVKRLAIFHHDPMHDDETLDEKIDRCRQRALRFNSGLLVMGAKEKMKVKLIDLE